MNVRKVLVIILTILALCGMITTMCIIWEYTPLEFIGFLICWLWCTLFVISNLPYLFKGIDKLDDWCYNMGTKIKELNKTINNYRKGEN